MMMRPPTPEALEFLGLVSVVFIVFAMATIVLVMAYSGYLVVKTKLPGRIEAFLGSSLFAVFFIWAQYMGGYLEMTLGPLGRLLEVIAWSASFTLFLLGHHRMLKRFRSVGHDS